MLLHPEKYTDEQLAQMLDETRVDIPDTNKEWQRLTGRIKEEERNREGYDRRPSGRIQERIQETAGI